MTDYEDKKKQEREWWEKKTEKKTSFIKSILHHPRIFSYARNSFNYIFPKKRMAEVVRNHLTGKVDKLLIAPCGAGDDLNYLGDFAYQVYGIDLSPIAAKQCPSRIRVKIGDILDSEYPNETFDLIASPLFFHHLLKIGFEPFLKEFHRILKDGGGIVILEPSVLYPINSISRRIKRIFGNVYDEIEDEDPFHPRLMLNSLRRTGFTNIELHAATFSHCSFYIPFAKLVNRLTKSLLSNKVLRYFGWQVVYWAEKHCSD